MIAMRVSRICQPFFKKIQFLRKETLCHFKSQTLCEMRMEIIETASAYDCAFPPFRFYSCLFEFDNYCFQKINSHKVCYFLKFFLIKCFPSCLLAHVKSSMVFENICSEEYFPQHKLAKFKTPKFLKIQEIRSDQISADEFSETH